MNQIIALSVASIAGGLSRFFIQQISRSGTGPAMPWYTVLINVIGCFLIGLVWAIPSDKFVLGPSARVVVMAGFCGAFTTFSGFILDIETFLRQGQYLNAAVYLFVSLIGGYALFRMGALLGVSV